MMVSNKIARMQSHYKYLKNFKQVISISINRITYEKWIFC